MSNFIDRDGWPDKDNPDTTTSAMPSSDDDDDCDQKVRHSDASSSRNICIDDFRTSVVLPVRDKNNDCENENENEHDKYAGSQSDIDAKNKNKNNIDYACDNVD